MRAPRAAPRTNARAAPCVCRTRRRPRSVSSRAPKRATARRPRTAMASRAPVRRHVDQRTRRRSSPLAAVRSPVASRRASWASASPRASRSFPPCPSARWSPEFFRRRETERSWAVGAGGSGGTSPGGGGTRFGGSAATCVFALAPEVALDEGSAAARSPPSRPPNRDPTEKATTVTRTSAAPAGNSTRRGRMGRFRRSTGASVD
jgi:hypothetical protein